MSHMKNSKDIPPQHRLCHTKKSIDFRGHEKQINLVQPALPTSQMKNSKDKDCQRRLCYISNTIQLSKSWGTD